MWYVCVRVYAVCLSSCIHTYVYMDFFLWRCVPPRVMASSFLRFPDHTQRRTTDGRTSLDEWSARRRDFYLTTHNTHNRQTSMPPAGFEPTISAGERSQTYALDRAATGTCTYIWIYKRKYKLCIQVFITYSILEWPEIVQGTKFKTNVQVPPS